VPYQLRALGIAGAAVLLPWERTPDCKPPRPGIADAVFGVSALTEQIAARPRLGVALSALPGAGARIDDVAEGSVAAAAGLRTGDVLIAVAGRQVRRTQDVLSVLARQAPGTWLPLKVRRDGAELDLVAKFPH
jgi:S1-C subfamily serine protease